MAGAEKVGQMTEVETHGTGSTDFHRIPRLSHEGDGQQMATDFQSTHSLDSSQSRQFFLFQMGQAKDTGNKLFQEGAWFMELHGKLCLDGNPNWLLGRPPVVG